jgi:outer membrane protein assembly factor BamB
MRVVAALAAVVALSGCGFNWFGNDEEPPLPGERRLVLVAEETLIADPTLATAPMVLPPPVTNESWAQRGGNARHYLEHVALALTLERRWSADLGRGNSKTSRIAAPPVVDGGRLFAADADARVQAFDLQTGRRLWRRDFEIESDRELGAGLAASGGGVFVATARGEVAALDAATGEIVWSQLLNAPVRAAPTLAGRFVVVLTADNQTYGLDAVSGAIVWAHQGFAEQTALLGGASPAATGGLVVVPYSSGEVYGLVLETGAPIWLDAVQRPRRTAAVGTISDILGSPVIDDDGRVFVAGHGGEIAALDAATGRRGWDARLATSEMPWVAGDHVFVVTTQGEVAALDAAGGGIRWAEQLPRFRRPDDPESDRIYHAGPVLAGGRLLVTGSLGTLWSLDPESGAILGTTDIPSGVVLPPLVAAGHLVLLDDDGTVHVYN